MLFIPTYIAEQLKKAKYEYDPEAKMWCAWAPELPGAYAQANTVEAVRTELAEVVEDYVMLAIQKGEGKKLFKKLRKSYAALAPSF